MSSSSATSSVGASPRQSRAEPEKPVRAGQPEACCERLWPWGGEVSCRPSGWPAAGSRSPWESHGETPHAAGKRPIGAGVGAGRGPLTDGAQVRSADRGAQRCAPLRQPAASPPSRHRARARRRAASAVQSTRRARCCRSPVCRARPRSSRRRLRPAATQRAGASTGCSGTSRRGPDSRARTAASFMAAVNEVGSGWA